MRVKLVTLSYAPSLQGFDDRPLAEFVRDKEVLAIREHFFTVHDRPHLACLITYQENAHQSQQGPEERPRENPLDGLAALQSLDGIGPAKVEKYGARLLELVNGTTPEAAP